jgi:hypothetical protein
MMRSLETPSVLLGCLLISACGNDSSTRRAESTGAGGSAGPPGGTGGTFIVSGDDGSTGIVTNPTFVRGCDVGKCTDFPEVPVLDGQVPPDAPARFAAAGAPAGGLCILEPQDGTLFPANWVRPRFRFAATGAAMFEIRIHADREKNDLVVYTSSAAWTMPKQLWTGLASNAFDEPITLTVRGISASGGAPVGMTSHFTIAPVNAGGSMVYWAADGPYNTGGNSWLVGFGVGEEGTVDALKVAQLAAARTLDDNGTLKRAETFGANRYQVGQVRCIGCHTSTPDGDAVAFTDSWPWNSVIASVKKETVGQRPSYVTDSGALLVNQAWLGAPTFSKGNWATGSRVMITSFGNPNGVGWSGQSFNKSNHDRLAWIDVAATAPLPAPGTDPGQLNNAVAALQGSAFGFLTRAGDSRAAVNPDWSHDGSRIAYASTDKATDGHVGGEAGQPIQSDIYVVPYGDRAGGQASPLAGAADPNAIEYYPDFSADDALIAFTRANATTGQVYYRVDGEIYVVASGGGTPTRLVANDPPACGGQASPGIINSWPKWSPSVESANGKAYYWLIFSSARRYPEQFELPKDQYSPPDTRSSQLYVAGIVVENGQVTGNYPAIYVWNQTKNTTNLTPAWDEFKIPPATIY